MYTIEVLLLGLDGVVYVMEVRKAWDWWLSVILVSSKLMTKSCGKNKRHGVADQIAVEQVNQHWVFQNRSVNFDFLIIATGLEQSESKSETNVPFWMWPPRR